MPKQWLPLERLLYERICPSCYMCYFQKYLSESPSLHSLPFHLITAAAFTIFICANLISKRATPKNQTSASWGGTGGASKGCQLIAPAMTSAANWWSRRRNVLRTRKGFRMRVESNNDAQKEPLSIIRVCGLPHGDRWLNSMGALSVRKNVQLLHWLTCSLRLLCIFAKVLNVRSEINKFIALLNWCRLSCGN